MARRKSNSPPLTVLSNVLTTLYPEPRSELHFSGEYQLIVSVILSAQCTDRKVNEVTPLLFQRYPTFAALASAVGAELENIIRSVNYFRTKTRNLIGMARDVMEQHQGVLPRNGTALRALPGVGNKTANVILGELGIEPAFPVDTHVFRLAHRLGLSQGKTPDEVEADLKRLFAQSEWRSLHHQLIFHGRRVCNARSPQCERCALNQICPSRGIAVTGSTKSPVRRRRG